MKNQPQQTINVNKLPVLIEGALDRDGGRPVRIAEDTELDARLGVAETKRRKQMKIK